MRAIQILCGLFVFVAVGCGEFFPDQTSGGGGSNTGDYIYVGNGNNRYIAGFAVSSSGALSVLPNSPYNNGVAVICSAITPETISSTREPPVASSSTQLIVTARSPFRTVAKSPHRM